MQGMARNSMYALVAAAAIMLLAGPAEAQKVSGLSISPNSVRAGGACQGTVTLDSRAPAGGKVVDLNGGVYTIPPSPPRGRIGGGGGGTIRIASFPSRITVPAGATSASFSIQGLQVPRTLTANISATTGGRYAHASLTVTK